MGLFSTSRKLFFTTEENDRVVNAIREAEKSTSGEIRVYIESRCRFVDPLHRAEEIFWGLKMDQTAHKNSVLLYVAMKDHQFSIFADKGIHEKLGVDFWKTEIEKMTLHFRGNHYIDALILVIGDIGNALQLHFPYDGKSDKNELPDDIVFGR